MMDRHLLALRRGPGPALVAVHAVVGHVIKYRRLARGIDRRFDVHGLQAIPFFLGGPRCDSVTQMTSRYVDELTDAGLSQDCVVAGYCLGGIFALELACRLKALGQPPALLVLIDAFYPLTLMMKRDGQLSQEGWLAFVEACAGLDYATSLKSDRSFWETDTLARLARVLSLTTAGFNMLLPQDSTLATVNDAFGRYSDYARAVDAHVPSRYEGKALCIGSPKSCESLQRNLIGKYLHGEAETIAIESPHAEFLAGSTADVVAQHINRKAGEP